MQKVRFAAIHLAWSETGQRKMRIFCIKMLLTAEVDVGALCSSNFVTAAAILLELRLTGGQKEFANSCKC